MAPKIDAVGDGVGVDAVGMGPKIDAGGVRRKKAASVVAAWPPQPD